MNVFRFSLRTFIILSLVLHYSFLSAEDASLDTLIKQLQSKDDQLRVEAISQISNLGPLAGKAVPAVIKSAQADDLFLRHESIIALGRIGAEAEQGADVLIKALDDPSLLIQYSAIQALRLINDPHKKAAIPKLKTLLKSKRPILRTSAAWALSQIDPEDEAQIERNVYILILGLKETNAHVRHDSMLALAQIGKPALSAVSKLLNSDNSELKMMACDILAEGGTFAQQVLPQLLPLLESKDPQVAWHAIRATGAIRSNATTVIPKLESLLSHSSKAVKTSALVAIGQFGAEAASSVPRIIPLLSDPEVSVRIEAAKTLGAIGPDSADAISDLLQTIKNDKNGTVTIYAAQALGQIGEQAVPVLSKLLSHKDYGILAASILGEIGPAAKPAVPGLLNMLSSEDLETRREALFTLARIGPIAKEEAAPRLIKMLKTDTADKSQAGAAYVLAKLNVREALPQLISNAKSSENKFLRLVSSWAIVSLEPQNREFIALALPELIKGLQDEKPRVRNEIAELLGEVGQPAESAVPSLLKMINDPDPSVRASVVSAIAEIGQPPVSTLPEAIKMLEDPVREVRYSAMHLLGRLGKAAKPAVSAIRPLLKSPDVLEKTIAAWALVHMTAEPEIISASQPLLISALDDADPRIRAEIASTLGDYFPGTASVKQALNAALKDENEKVQQAAKQALEKLGNK